jgi:hypothetical protein
MYVEIGDNIALQYGGSEAHKKVTADRPELSISGPMGKVGTEYPPSKLILIFFSDCRHTL